MQGKRDDESEAEIMAGVKFDSKIIPNFTTKSFSFLSTDYSTLLHQRMSGQNKKTSHTKDNKTDLSPWTKTQKKKRSN